VVASRAGTVIPDDDPGGPRIGPEVRAQRLGFALRGLAAELVDERRKVAQLHRELAELRARLEVLEPTHGAARRPARPSAPR
jgi:uncharacterized coiled-coil protein SlyX